MTRGLKGSGPFFQKIMASNFLSGYVTRIYEIYIDDVLIFGKIDDQYIGNSRKVLVRIRSKKVTANPEKIRLGGVCWAFVIQRRHILHP